MQPSGLDMAAISQMVEAGQIRPVIDRTFLLDNVRHVTYCTRLWSQEWMLKFVVDVAMTDLRRTGRCRGSTAEEVLIFGVVI